MTALPVLLLVFLGAATAAAQEAADPTIETARWLAGCWAAASVYADVDAPTPAFALRYGRIECGRGDGRESATPPTR